MFYFTVRLIDGNAPHEGRVEIFYDGVWGTICHDYWELAEANVVCRQLGFDGAVLALRSAAYGQGKGVIWMDDVSCTGSETAISKCKHRGWRVTDCVHNQDAGVVCKPKGKMCYSVILMSQGAIKSYFYLTIRSILPCFCSVTLLMRCFV